jgi:hypothetical protein
METLRGSSGVLHTFTEVSKGPMGTKVMESCNAEACETDVMRLWIKALDVGARAAELVAPSYTPMALELAKEYKIKLRNSTTHSQTRSQPRRSGRRG